MTPDAPAESAPASADRRALLIVFLVVVIDLLGFGIVLPLQPRYADRFLPEDVPGWARGAVIGALFASFSAMQFIFSPFWGRVSDRIGRRPILLMGLSGSVVFYSLFGYAATLGDNAAWLALGLMLVSRIGAGIAGATVSTAAAVIADTTPPEGRSRGMALIGAAFGIGFTIGPIIAWLGLTTFQDAPWGPGAMAAGLSFVALLLAIRLMPETLKTGTPSERRQLFNFRRTAEVLRTPTVGALVLIYFLAIFGFANLEGTLALFTDRAFGLTERQNYLVFAYVGFVLMVAQGGVYRPLAKRVPEETFLKAGVGLMLLGLGGLGAVALAGGTGLFVPFFLALACSVTGFAFLNPSVASLVSRRSDPARQGEVLGVNQSFAALGRILGPSLGPVLYLADPMHVLPYVLAAGLMLVVIALIPRVTRAAA